MAQDAGSCRDVQAVDDGGPAFPHAQRLWDHDAQSWAVHSVGGMSLRNWLSGLAMQAIIGRELQPNRLGNGHVNHAYVRDEADAKWTARKAVEYADALILALKKR